MRLEYPGVLTSKWGDGFRDYLVGHYIVQYGERPLLGPFNLLYYSGLRNSPFYYYLLALIIAVKDNVMSLSIANAILQTASILLIFLITKLLFDEKSAFIASVLFAFTPAILSQTEFIWQPVLMQPPALLSLYLLSAAYFRRKEASPHVHTSYKLLIAGTIFLVIAATLHNSIFTWFPQFLIMAFLFLKQQQKNLMYYLGIIAVLILVTLILYSPVLLYLANHRISLTFQDHFYSSSLTNYLDNLHFNSEQMIDVFSLNNLLVVFLILICVIYLKAEKSVKKYYFIFLLLFLLEPLLISSLFNKNQLHYLISSLGLMVILISVSLSRVITNRFLLTIVVIFLFITTSQNLKFLLPQKEEAGNHQLVLFAAKTIAKETQNTGSQSFQIISYANRQNRFRYPILDTVLLVPLENLLNLKLARISDDSPYTLIQTNDNKYLFLSCFEFDSPDLVTNCSESFLLSFPNYQVERNIYNQYPISVYLAKRLE